MNTPDATTTLALIPVTGPLATPVTSGDHDALLVHMAYRTSDGREAAVVFSGNEDDFDSELRAYRNEAGATRLRYEIDGAKAYDWYTGPLTPLGWYTAPVAVQFKDEGDLDGDTVGPMRLLFEGEDPHRARHYRADRRGVAWMPREHALAVATSLNVPLMES